MQRNSGISLAILVICLCLGSLIVVSTINSVSLSTQEISEPGAEDNSPSFQTEFGEEFLFEVIVGAIIAPLLFSKFGPINLGFQAVSFVPVSPPPKYA
jgi:hypothetical protein